LTTARDCPLTQVSIATIGDQRVGGVLAEDVGRRVGHRPNHSSLDGLLDTQAPSRSA